MPTFIMLGRLTTQAKKNGMESRATRDRLFAEFQKLGVKITAYTTLGPYDVVNLIEAPTEELAMKFLMAAGSTGNIDSTTLRAFTEEESKKFRA